MCVEKNLLSSLGFSSDGGGTTTFSSAISFSGSGCGATSDSTFFVSSAISQKLIRIELYCVIKGTEKVFLVHRNIRGKSKHSKSTRDLREAIRRLRMNLLLTLEGLVGGMVDHTSKAVPAGHPHFISSWRYPFLRKYLTNISQMQIPLDINILLS